MDPLKLAEFTKGTLLPDAAKKFAENALNDKRPKGLK